MRRCVVFVVVIVVKIIWFPNPSVLQADDNAERALQPSVCAGKFFAGELFILVLQNLGLLVRPGGYT